MRWLLRFALLLLVASPFVLVLAVREGWVEVPNDWNPWAALEIDAVPNALTRYKLARVSADPQLCRTVLSTARVTFEVLTDRVTGPQCGFTNAVRIDRTSSELDESFSLTCPAAVSLALWERHVVQPAAQHHFQAPVTKLEHFGSYSCRNVYGRQNARRSQHATAQALDVAGFVIGNEQRVRVIRDWDGKDPAAMFLREVRDGACRFFDGVLSPDYNAAHRDHFHLDRGPYRVCR